MSAKSSPVEGNIDSLLVDAASLLWAKSVRKIQRAKESGDSEGVVRAMQSGAMWPLVVKTGAKCICAMSATGTAQTDIDFGRHGAIPVLVRGLDVHGETNASVATAGCGALRNLACGNNDANKTTIVSSGGIPLIFRLLEAHGETNASVAEAGCGVLCSLTHKNDANTATIVSSGGIPLIFRLL